MVVLDIGMPLLDGAQLLGIIHQRYPNIKKVVLTGAIDDRRRSACLANGAELFLVKPATDDGWTLVFNMLTSLVRWEDHDAYSGVLGEIGLPSILQMECIEGKSSILEVRNPQTSGEIYIEAGAIVHAEAGKLTGIKAFHQLLSLTIGEFRLIPFREPPQHTLLGPWQTLLDEAARSQQEDISSGGDDDDTILITRKKTVAQPPAPAPMKPVPETKTELLKTAPAPAAPPASAPELKMAQASPSKPAPAAPAKPAPPSLSVTTPGPALKMASAAPPQPPPPRLTAGMNVVTLEEIVEADTTVVPVPGKNGQSSDGPGKK